MATATTSHVSCSSVYSPSYGEFSVNDLSCCELLNTELQVLHNEAKSLNEIINILDSELKTTRSTEVIKTHSESAATLR